VLVANLRGAILDRCIFVGARLDGCDLRNAQLARADLSGASIAGALFHTTDLDRTNFEGTRGAEKAIGLEYALGNDPPERSFQHCRRPLPERVLDWERLRAVGRLPLFGASYTALLLIPPFFFGLGLYNDKIVLLRRWAERTVPEGGEQHTLAKLITERLHPVPLPTDASLMLGATVLLALASTIISMIILGATASECPG
jgi:hypothetical protein